MKISIVVPVYGCPEAIESLTNRIVCTVRRITTDYEIILVNDGCPYDSWDKIKKECVRNDKVVGINLTRNYGQVNATNAGLEYSDGDYVVLMDCDLQDPPEAIYDMFAHIKSGYDVVFAERVNRKDTGVTVYLSHLYYKFYNSMIDGHYNPNIGNLCMVTRRVVDAYCDLNEHNKSFVTMLAWMNYSSYTIKIEGGERFARKSSYNFSRKINLAIMEITTHSNKPLLLIAKTGICVVLAVVVFLIYQLVVWAVTKSVPEGWMSIIASILIVGGVQLFAMGITGIYIGNIFIEARNRKAYYIQEIINDRMEKTSK